VTEYESRTLPVLRKLTRESGAFSVAYRSLSGLHRHVERVDG